MVNWKNIDDLRNIFIEKYVNSKLESELEKACNEEYELMVGYNGRQILELLQNVDDAYGDKKVKENISSNQGVIVKISYKANILEVGNTGTSFTDETIERLCLGRASDKSKKNIGNKGTGFRSLLNDAEWIELFSGNFSIRFSEKYTRELFTKYIDKGSEKFSKLIAEQNKNWKKEYPFSFPIMNCPEKIENYSSEFDTLIRVKIKEGNYSKATSIAKQIEQPFYKSLLFLPNITKIIIETDNDKKEFEKITGGNDIFIEYESKGISNAEEFYVYKKTTEIGEKMADLIIAIPKNLEYDFTKEKLYCFFPIRNFPTPIHALIHAPFITNNSRDDIPDDNDQINEKIFHAVLEFIKEIAEKLTKTNFNNISVKFVTPFKNNKLWNSDGFNLWERYLNLLGKAKIFLTVNKTYISIEDGSKILENDFPEEFNGEPFNNLLKNLDYDNIEFIKELAKSIRYKQLDYDITDLAEKINSLSDNWKISQRIKVFLWWSKNYKSAPIIPKLLKDSNNNWIEKNNSKKVFLPTDGGISILPPELSWVTLCVLYQDYVNELILDIKTTGEWKDIEKTYEAEHVSDKRLLDAFSKKYFAVEFTEQSSSVLIIRTINNQIDSVDKSVSFINWLFKNYNDKLGKDTELSKLPFNLPNHNGEIKSSSELFFGKEYGNELAEKLFANTSFSSLITIKKLYQGNNKDAFISFLRRCGILKFPRITDTENENLATNGSFLNYIAEKYKDKFHFKINYLKSKKIQNFEKLIQSLNTKEILEWIKSDENLKNLLYSQECDSRAAQQRNQYGENFYSNEYVKFVLNTTEWIEFSDRKYKPVQIVKYEKLGDKIDDLYGISERSLRKYLGEDVVTVLNFRNVMTEFSDKTIKLILDGLPSFDKGEISRKLYLEIIENKKDKIPEYSTKGIEVLAQNGKFYTNNEVFYADRRLPNSIEKQKNKKFISIPPKRNIKTIKDWLGVERYKTNLNLQSYSELNQNRNDFEREIDEIKIVILSTIIDNSTNVEKLKRLKIIPCTSISAKDLEQNNNLLSLEDYSFVEYENVYYLKVPNNSFSIEALRREDEFPAAIVDIFQQVLTLDLNSDLIELLISKNSVFRKKKIADNYGIDKWDNSSKLLFNESALSEMVVNYFKENNLDNNSLKKIEKIDLLSYPLLNTDYETLIRAVRTIKKDIDDLNNISESINIDISEYWYKKLKHFLESNYENYKQACYSAAKNGDTNLKSEFLTKLYEYMYFDIHRFCIKNSVEINVDEIAIKQFPELKEIHNKSNDIDGTYNANVSTILERAQISRGDFYAFIEKEHEINSILYFEIPNKIYPKIKEYLKREDLRDFKDNGKITDKITSTKSTKLEIPDVNDFHSANKGKRERSQKSYMKQNNENNDAGRLAEQIAYIELKKSYPKLIWHSKYSTNPADRNNLPPNEIVCDMWVSDSENGNKYFEIKSATTEFEMTINEYSSMERNSEHYEVVLVNRETKEISRYRFDELEVFKQISGYVFRFKQIDNGKTTL